MYGYFSIKLRLLFFIAEIYLDSSIIENKIFYAKTYTALYLFQQFQENVHHL